LNARDHALVGLIVLAWAFNFLTSAVALDHFPPFLFTALRFAVVLAVLFPFLRAPAPGHWGRLMLICLCNGALHFGFNFWALKLGGISLVAILMQSYVPMATLLAWLFLGERVGWRTATGVALSFAGVLLLGFDPAALAVPSALALSLMAALLLAIGTVSMRGLRGVNALQLQAWSALLGIPVLLAIALMLEGDLVATIAGAGLPHWGGVVYSGLIASIVGHGLLYVLVQRHPVSSITPFLLLTPVIAIALGLIFRGEAPGPLLYLGGAMVLGGVLVVALRTRARARQAPAPAEA
jgi:O-acetylserine/cysteine efflux transporter